MRSSCWCPELLRLYLACRSAGERLSDEDMDGAYRLGEVETLAELAGKQSVARVVRYLLRQIELDQEKYLYDPEIDLYVDPEEYIKISVTMLRDYWRMAETAGWDLSSPAVRWPKALEAAHDRAIDAERAALKELSGKLFRQQYRKRKRYSFALDGILIRPCRSQQELTREGERLKHCVAGYADDVATGRTAIFFIRRTKRPNEPWYTLELDEKTMTVRQNRGERNCAPPEAVKRFEAAWLRWLRAGAPRDRQGGPIIQGDAKKGVTAA